MASSLPPSPSGRRLLFPPRLPDLPPGLRIRRSTTLSVADTAALLLPAAYDGDVPKFKMLVKRLRKAGKGVEEALAEIKSSSYFKYRGHGPLHLAALSAKPVMCKYLLKDLNLDVNAGGEDGVTPLFFAIYGTGSTAITRLLLDHHADPNKAAYDGATPLLVAICEDTYEIAELLLSRRAYADPVSEYGTPLYIAARDGNVRMLKLLLQHQADPNVVLHTPLKATTSACSLGMELLTKTDADVNPGTITPLIAAAYAGSTDCIKCLLKAGADANIPDHNGRIPLEVAAIQGCQESVDLLSFVTTPSVQVTDWSTGEIIQHAKPTSSKPDGENDGPDFEAQGDYAFFQSDYAQALNQYTMAVEINPDDSALYAKRSLCLLHMGDKGKALDDAYTYRDMKPNLSISCYAQGAALILVKEYGRAIEELMYVLNLDFEREPAEKALSVGHP
ncbi:hypothetical protein SETIT_2G168500v2 [Setaria italica]|uniref:Uncharacterized protein n=1 Tax=Setaria italica TaxID=4555 RepID=A0A368PZI2_SETIT|nr:ankyrin-1 isoform X1 [Setaria italica]RCV11216.1 hypothetical protein SETIT_2G168500v2 [Setaria italica]